MSSWVVMLPSTERILELFAPLQRHRLRRKGRLVQIFEPELNVLANSRARRPLTLLRDVRPVVLAVVDLHGLGVVRALKAIWLEMGRRVPPLLREIRQLLAQQPRDDETIKLKVAELNQLRVVETLRLLEEARRVAEEQSPRR